MRSMKLIRIPQYLGKNDIESKNTISMMKLFETFLWLIRNPITVLSLDYVLLFLECTIE